MSTPVLGRAPSRERWTGRLFQSVLLACLGAGILVLAVLL